MLVSTWIDTLDLEYGLDVVYMVHLLFFSTFKSKFQSQSDMFQTPGTALAFSLALCPWANCLISLSLSFIMCKMRVIITLSQDCFKANMVESQFHHWYHSKFYQSSKSRFWILFFSLHCICNACEHLRFYQFHIKISMNRN